MTSMCCQWCFDVQCQIWCFLTNINHDFTTNAVQIYWNITGVNFCEGWCTTSSFRCYYIWHMHFFPHECCIKYVISQYLKQLCQPPVCVNLWLYKWKIFLILCSGDVLYLSVAEVIEDGGKFFGASAFVYGRVGFSPVYREFVKPHVWVLQVCSSDAGIKTMNLTPRHG